MANTENTYHEDLVREYATLQQQAEPLLGRMDEIKKCLRDLDYGTHDIAGLKVGISRNARLNPTRFAAAYPVMQHPGLYKTAPNPDAIKKQLAPAEIEKYQDLGEPRVSIR